MPVAVIDACCLIDLLASGEIESILRASGFDWRMPVAVQAEVRYCRQRHPTQAGKIVSVPVDLTDLLTSGVLTQCDLEDEPESDQFMRYAALFRSDGEAMCLALAEHRQWTVATDDRRAVRISQQAGLTVVSCPQLIKAWVDATGPSEDALHRVLHDVEVLAQFKPYPALPHYQWWVDEIAKFNP